MNLNEQPQIIGLANALALDVINPVEAIRVFCRQKVERFLRGASRVPNMIELQNIVCVHLNLVVHEVWSHEELNALANKYVSAGEIVFSTLSKQLSPDAFGVLFRLPKKGRRPRFVAVIDCRGDKHLRRYWTIWHEISHALTDVEQFQLPLRRTTVDGPAKDPIEQITDMVAADFAFFDKLFLPVFHDELGDNGRVSFKMADCVRNRFCTDASLASTINACVTAAPMPTILIEAGLAYKKSERERITAGEQGIKPTLRVLRSISNPSAREAHLHIPRNMRVPLSSVITRVYSESIDGLISHETAPENLSAWTTTQGVGLPDLDVMIEARSLGERVLALVSYA